MKITIQQSIAGHADERYDLDEFSFAPGSVVEVNDDLAAAWIDSGVAAKAKKSAVLTSDVAIITPDE